MGGRSDAAVDVMQEQDDGVLLVEDVDEGVCVLPVAGMHAAAPRGMVEGRVRGAAPRSAAKDLDNLLLERVAEGKDVANVGDRATVVAAADARVNQSRSRVIVAVHVCL